MSLLRSARGNGVPMHHSESGIPIRARFLWFKDLGNQKILSLQRFMGKVRLHLRNYTLEDEEYVLIPTKKGVVLDKQQTRDFLNSVKDLERVIKHVSYYLYYISHGL